MNYFVTFVVIVCYYSEHIFALEDTDNQGNLYGMKQQQHNGFAPYRTSDHFPYESALYALDGIEFSFIGNKTPPFVIDETCKAYLLAYSSNASDFVHCAVKYARPFRFCGLCVVPYTRATNLYFNIVKKGDGTCGRQLLNSDKIHILTQTHNYMVQLWTDSECSKCFSSVLEHKDGSVDYEIENKTLIFLELYNETGTCMNVTDDELTDPSRWLPAGNTSVCKQCKEQYDNLNEHFNDILHVSKNHVCMDVMDIMNYTRQMWSQYFNCSHRTGDMLPILALTAVFCMCPILFYVGNRLHGEPDSNRQKIVKQKRFRFRRTPQSYGTLPIEEEIVIPPPSPKDTIQT